MSLRSFFLLLALVLASPGLFPGSARAQTFDAGDLYLYSRALPGVAIGILRIDPVTGSTNLLADLSAGAEPLSTLSWDPYRGRLLGARNVVGGTGGVYAVDAAGVVSSPAPAEPTPNVVASRGDGIVYLWTNGITPTLRYLDASNVGHDVLDVAGTSAYTLAAAVSEMIYHPGTNSLVLFQENFGSTAVCPVTTALCAIRLPLDASGTQVVGAESIVQYDVSFSGERPVGSGYLPGGDLLLVADTNSNNEEARMLALDPAAMTLTPWATNNSAATTAGTYTSATDRTVLIDTLLDVARAYAAGGSGGGTVLATGVSTAGGSGEGARLVSIHTAALAPVPLLGPAGIALLAFGAVAAGLRRVAARVD